MASVSKTSSRIKNKGQQKIVFAKDKKQLVLAVIVLSVFFINSIYMIAKNFTNQNHSAKNENISRPEDLLTQQQSINPSDTQNVNANNSVPNNANVTQDANNIYSQTLALQNNQNPNSQTINTNTPPDENIDIMVKKKLTARTGKMVLITVSTSGRPNPFLPETEEYMSNSKMASYSLLPSPPETLPTNSDAGRVMATKISGILYDKYSPSAIINIEGSDYLVKQGDIIKNYRVLSIGHNQVVVKLGANIYQAGVGQLLIPTSLNYNTIANLNKKFGGNDISINIRKKGY